MSDVKRGGCLTNLLVIGGVMIAGVTVLTLLPDAPASVTGSTTASSNFRQCDEEWSRQALLVIKETSLIRGEDASGPREGLVVMVRPRAWAGLTFGQQQRLAAIYDCVIAGNGGHLTHVRFRYERNGPDLADFDSGMLLDLREAGGGTEPPASKP